MRSHYYSNYLQVSHFQEFYKDFMKLCQSYKVVAAPKTPDKQEEKGTDKEKQIKAPRRPGFVNVYNKSNKTKYLDVNV